MIDLIREIFATGSDPALMTEAFQENVLKQRWLERKPSRFSTEKQEHSSVGQPRKMAPVAADD